MSIKILRKYIKECKSKNIEPTFVGLKKYREVIR